MNLPRPLVATYRLQLRTDRDLVTARDALDHLVALGVSHLYLAPILQAGTDSTHGYDVVDPTCVDEALGGEAAFEALVSAAHARGIGIVLDIVPNHMATDPDHNPWWRDVLRHGRASRYAGHFDITWDPPDHKLRDQVLVPVLDDHYGRVLDRQELCLERQATELAVRYRDRSFPIALPTCLSVLHRAAASASSGTLDLVIRSLEHLATRPDDPDHDGSTRRAIIDAASVAVADSFEDRAVADAIDDAIRETNSDPEALHAILDAQHYRLARWQTGADELDYRRFFDITDLVAARVERSEVFGDTHARIGGWVATGAVDGLRVDHPDGLADPGGYLEDLRRLAPDSWIVVEKILEGDEALPDWPVDGTTGYELAAAFGRLLVDPTGYERIAEQLPADSGVDFVDVVRRAKAEVLQQGLAAELRRLTDALVAVCEDQPRFRDFTRRDLREALIASLACFPVYRSYVTADGSSTEQDRRFVQEMVTDAAVWRPEVDRDLFGLVAGSLLGTAPFGGAAPAAFRLRFQQLSGAVMAKGKEDTALYRFPVVLAANEVGADPGRPSSTVEDFHVRLGEVASGWSATMVTTSTHDTKRSEDVRARLAVLSEVPDRYLDSLADFRKAVAAGPSGELDPLFDALCLQSLVGAHPISTERLGAYLEKALREAGVRTSWLRVDEDYEARVDAAVQFVTSDEAVQGIVATLLDEILVDGRVSSLVQRLLLLTVPGIPDVYQGTELWDLSLVDPDNRRSVDLAARAELLADGGWADRSVPVPGWHSLSDETDPGTAKLALTARALHVRRGWAASFEPGATYRPLRAGGGRAQHVVAYQRGEDIAVVVPRMTATVRRSGGWADTSVELPEGRWSDLLTPDISWAGRVGLDELLARVPVALLARDR